jgi:hypothetical protein
MSTAQSRIWPIGLVLTLLVLLVPLGIAQSGGGGTTIPVVKTGSGSCILKAGDLDTANECVIPYGSAFPHSAISVVLTSNFQFGIWNQTYTIFQGNLSLAGIVNQPLSNITQFIERGYAGIGEMMVNFRSDSGGNCEPSGAILHDQYSPDGAVWTNLPISVPVDCSGNSYSLDNTFGPLLCSSLNGLGVGAFPCWNNATSTCCSINSTVAKGFQNTYNRLFLSTSAATSMFLYRVDLNLLYGSPLGCTILAQTLTNFTPECGSQLGIEFLHSMQIYFAWTAYGT